MIGALAILALARAGAAAARAPVSVEDCVRRALDRSPSAQAAAAAVAAAEARVRQARAAYWPRLIGQAQYGKSGGYDTAITNGGMTQFGVAVDTPLFDGGLRDAQLAAARARLRSSAAQAQQRRADVAFAVRSAYFSALSARSELEIQADTARALTNYLALLQRQVGLGLMPPSDVPRAALAVETARSAERAASSGLVVALQALSELTGTVFDAASLVEPAARPLAPTDEAAIEASPAIADVRAAAEAAHRDVDAARSEQRGRLALTADTGFLGVEPDRTFRDNGGGEFLLGFSVPLFDGGALAARVAESAATAAGAEADVGQARQTLVITLAQTRADAQRALVDAEAWQRLLPAAADGFLLMRARYFGGGGAQLVDVLDALGQSVDARLAVPHALLVYRLAVATQEQTLGEVEP